MSFPKNWSANRAWRNHYGGFETSGLDYEERKWVLLSPNFNFGTREFCRNGPFIAHTDVEFFTQDVAQAISNSPRHRVSSDSEGEQIKLSTKKSTQVPVIDSFVHKVISINRPSYPSREGCGKNRQPSPVWQPSFDKVTRWELLLFNSQIDHAINMAKLNFISGGSNDSRVYEETKHKLIQMIKKSPWLQKCYHGD